MTRKKDRMLTDKDIIGKTLGQCMDDINKKLDNHIAHGDIKMTSLDNKYQKIDTKVDGLMISFEKGFTNLTTEMSWVKKISLAVFLAILGLAFYIIQSGLVT